METMMAITARFSGGRRVIPVNNRRGWWRGDFQGSAMLSFCNLGKRDGGVGPRENFNSVTAFCTVGIGVRGGYHDDDGGFDGGVDGKRIITEQLEHWLHNSLAEIVKNVGEAPLLVHIYAENGPESSKLPSSSTTKMRYVMEKVTSDSWTNIRHRWDNTIPNGIVLVEELGIKPTKQEHQDKSWCLDSTSSSSSSNNNSSSRSSSRRGGNNEGLIMESSSSSSATRLWGVLVQGKGVNFHSCYLLKTCQVKCCFGSSTHFCLAKVDNSFFGKSYDFHLTQSWLQR